MTESGRRRVSLLGLFYYSQKSDRTYYQIQYLVIKKNFVLILRCVFNLIND